MKWTKIKRLAAIFPTIWIHPADRPCLVHLAKAHNCFEPTTVTTLLRMNCIGSVLGIPVFLDKFQSRLAKTYLICA